MLKKGAAPFFADHIGCGRRNEYAKAGAHLDKAVWPPLVGPCLRSLAQVINLTAL
jgi:hypothetical protein